MRSKKAQKITAISIILIITMIAIIMSIILPPKLAAKHLLEWEHEMADIPAHEYSVELATGGLEEKPDFRIEGAYIPGNGQGKFDLTVEDAGYYKLPANEDGKLALSGVIDQDILYTDAAALFRAFGPDMVRVMGHQTPDNDPYLQDFAKNDVEQPVTSIDLPLYGFRRTDGEQAIWVGNAIQYLNSVYSPVVRSLIELDAPKGFGNTLSARWTIDQLNEVAPDYTGYLEANTGTLANDYRHIWSTAANAFSDSPIPLMKLVGAETRVRADAITEDSYRGTVTELTRDFGRFMEWANETNASMEFAFTKDETAGSYTAEITATGTGGQFIKLTIKNAGLNSLILDVPTEAEALHSQLFTLDTKLYGLDLDKDINEQN